MSDFNRESYKRCNKKKNVKIEGIQRTPDRMSKQCFFSVVKHADFVFKI